MKTIQITFLCILFSQLSCAQPSDAIVKYYKSKKYINIENFLFTPEELIELCKDSIGKSVFTSNINRYAKNISKNSDEGKEKIILLSTLNRKIQSVSINNTNKAEGKAFLTQALKSFRIEFPIDEHLLLSRFTWSESRSETCNIERSLFIFFVHDPILYSKTVKKDIDLKKQQAPFPFSCTLENVNIPVLIRIKMKLGLLEQLKNFKDPTLVNISDGIRKTEILESNN
jgi:hypothetical protein